MSVSGRYVQQYIGFDNCIVLNNPRIDKTTKRDLVYEKEPWHIGINIDNKLLSQFEIGIKVHTLPKKKIALLTPKQNFLKAIRQLNIDFLDIQVPAIGVKISHLNKKFDKDFILIMFASNGSGVPRLQVTCHDVSGDTTDH